MRIYLPWNNLGALGFRIRGLYFDIYSRRSWGKWVPGLFISTQRTKLWITPFKISR